MADGPATVLFDLDGTLLDTAPDMLAALQQLADENQRPCRIDYTAHKALVTRGAKSLIASVFGPLDENRMQSLRARYLEIYQSRLAVETRLFAGIETVLETLGQQGIAWGIVTNKPGWLCEPLLQSLPPLHDAAVLVAGDTLPVTKPDPRPLLHALRALSGKAAHCLYVGDAATDVQAAQRAGMPAAVALWGYLHAEDRPETWPARLLNHPREILQCLSI